MIFTPPYFDGVAGAGSIFLMAEIRQPSDTRVNINVVHIERLALPATPAIS